MAFAKILFDGHLFGKRIIWDGMDKIRSREMDQASSSQTELIIKILKVSSLSIQFLSDPPKPDPIYLMGSRTLQVPNSPQALLRSARLHLGTS